MKRLAAADGDVDRFYDENKDFADNYPHLVKDKSKLLTPMAAVSSLRDWKKDNPGVSMFRAPAHYLKAARKSLDAIVQVIDTFEERWPEIEDRLAKNKTWYAILYAVNVVKARLPDIEKYILVGGPDSKQHYPLGGLSSHAMEYLRAMYFPMVKQRLPIFEKML